MEHPNELAGSRYEILDRIGEGGMGEVFRAHDRDLDREVAIKQIKPWALDERARARLAREAQAMAQLSHPNVVAVYGVVSNEHEVSLVMELIHGPTLAQWMNDGPHPWREVVEVFLQAARGLDAAHDAGVVHRDFKPANVMIGDDGRVRVTDFGLARPSGASVDELRSEPRPDSQSTGTAWDELLTATGTVVGTPAYMAPEQFQDHPADGRADQYALSVALWQALCGQRPYRGDSYVDLGRAKMHPPPPWPATVDVPRRLQRAIRRGLHPRAEDRWPSMRALIDELDAVMESRRPRRSTALAAVAVLGAGALAVGLAWPDDEPRCEDAASLREGLWSDARRAEVATAVQATGASFAAGTWETLRPTLDAYAAQWADRRAELCGIGTPVDPHLDARLRCLLDRKEAFEAVTAALVESDRMGLVAASRAAAALPGLARCDDRDGLDEPPLPADPAVAQRVTELRQELARAHAQMDARRCDDALASLGTMEDAVDSTGHAPLRAEHRMARGRAARCNADFAASGSAFEEAYFLSTEHELGSLAARAAIELVEVVGVERDEHEEGKRWLEHARAELSRRPDDPAHARFHAAMGELHHVSGRYPEAVEAYRQSLALMREARAAPLELALVEGKMADSLRTLGRHDEALAIIEELVELSQRTLGPEHPSVAMHMVALASIHNEIGQPLQAESLLRRAQGLIEETYDDDHPSVLKTIGNLAMTLSILGRTREAIVLHERTIAGMEARFGEDHPNVAIGLNNMGVDQLAIGDVAGATASHRRALEIREQALGPDHVMTASSITNLAESRLIAGEIEAAREGFARALPVLEAGLGPEAFPVSYPLTGLGTALIESDRWAEAVPLLERALTIRESSPSAPPELMETRFQLARALARAGERDRALELGRTALEAVQGLEGEVDGAARLRAWLGEQG